MSHGLVSKRQESKAKGKTVRAAACLADTCSYRDCPSKKTLTAERGRVWPSLCGTNPLEKQGHVVPRGLGGDGVRVQPQL